MQRKGMFTLFNLAEFIFWLAEPCPSGKITRPITKLQVHHTAVPSYKNFDGGNHFPLLVGMRDYHMHQAKPSMAEIAQNLTIFPDGVIALCRPFDVMPAGIYGANKNALCVEILGNFDIGNDAITASQKEAVIGAYAAMCNRFKITPDSQGIVYHHWFDLTTGDRTDGLQGKLKSCPGTAFFGGNTIQAAEATGGFYELIRHKMEGEVAGHEACK